MLKDILDCVMRLVYFYTADVLEFTVNQPGNCCGLSLRSFASKMQEHGMAVRTRLNIWNRPSGGKADKE